MIGNWEALRWGMLGLAVKGGIYISFGGLLLGMGLSAVRYRPLEILLLMLAALGMGLAYIVSILGLTSLVWVSRGRPERAGDQP